MRADDLAPIVESLKVRVDSIEEQLRQLRHQHEALRIQAESGNSRLSVVEREVENLKRSGDEWGRRAWAVLLALVSAIIGGAITYLLKR
jgi:predicted  nucleic acid-binding Zn-ribbon protein